jgi:glycosyltransferase involved in cell wall biosynthesis
MTTIHILTSPYSPVNINNRVDPFSIAAIKFIDHMTRLGWNCVHYGIAGSEVSCENVICVDDPNADRSFVISNYNNNAGVEISRRKQPGDIIACFHGIENRGACDANSDLKAVEPSIGYMTEAVWAPYRAFVSYAQMHMFYGARGMLMEPSWYDAVIPNAITSSEFEFNQTPDDYFLYFGRVISSKGVDVAIQATEKAGKQLIVAGPGSLAQMGYQSTPSHVTEVGVCNPEQRKKLMAGAKAVLGPTYYVEPFGNMVAEAYMCGTPSITTDWGGFTETVQHGHTGFRCREFREFVDAIENIDSIDRATCREWSMANYDDEIVHQQFDQYFKKILTGDFYRQ